MCEPRVGDLVRVRGESSDFTDYVDSLVGKVISVDYDAQDALVEFDQGRLWIWFRNIMEVVDHE